jgi:hypothetical protein
LLFAACSGGDGGERDDRCRDGACCAEGERMADGYPHRCPHGGLTAACERSGGNCILRTDDGAVNVNCWSPNCDACTGAPDYMSVVIWCSNN